jgi:hypothetical protein
MVVIPDDDGELDEGEGGGEAARPRIPDLQPPRGQGVVGVVLQRDRKSMLLNLSLHRHSGSIK